MTLNESASCAVSAVLAVLTFSAAQILKSQLTASQSMTIIGGFIGSLIFVFVLTSLSNLEKILLGKGHAAWLEVVISLCAAVGASATIHRVSATTCVLFSSAILYGMFRLSQDMYEVSTVSAGTASVDGKNKKRK